MGNWGGKRGPATTKKGAKVEPSFVYFIEAIGCDLVKIGYTERAVATRLRQLRPMSPVPLAVVGVIEGGEVLEREIHLRFRSQWSHGEWFRKTDELVAYVAESAVEWEEPEAEFKRHLIAKRRLEDGSMPPTAERLLAEWAATTRLFYFGQTKTVAEWSKIFGKSLQTIKRRVDGGSIPENLFVWFDDFSDVPSNCAPRPPMEEKPYRPKAKPRPRAKPAAEVDIIPDEKSKQAEYLLAYGKLPESAPRPPVAALVKPPVKPEPVKPLARRPIPPKRYGPLQAMLDAAREDTP